MRRSVCFVSFIISVFMAGQCLCQNPVRIMPLGDSITFGSGGVGGYRLPLYTNLLALGYNVDYVGTQIGNSDPALGTEINHEGHGGWRITSPTIGIYDFVHGWFEQIEDPHVILLHIGTNDSGQSYFPTSIDDLDLLITRLALAQPDAHIIVTSLMKRDEPNYTNITNYFNPYVPGKVSGQQALGRNVTFLDMHAYLELGDMPDDLHPDAGGYAKMAAAWLPAITNLVGTNPGPNRPAPIRAIRNSTRDGLDISFNKPVSYNSATNISNYTIDGGVTVLSAALDAGQRKVTLATSPQTGGQTYTVTMSNIEDETTPSPLAIPAGSELEFTAETPRGAGNNVAESGEYSLVYELDIPSAASYKDTYVQYGVDRSALIPSGSFSRIAYYMELQKAGEDLQYVWVSMNAFATDPALIGVPIPSLGIYYQQYVNSLNVFCNVAGVTTGTGLPGNIEF